LLLSLSCKLAFGTLLLTELIMVSTPLESYNDEILVYVS
jgi:hypothetical protein